MTKKSKYGLPLVAIVLSLVVALTLIIAACGGDDDDGAPAPTQAAAPTAAPTVAPAPTQAPAPTAAPTAVPTTAAPPMEPVPVSPRLILAVPPPSQEVGVIHLANNLTSSFLIHYDHLLASDPQTAAYGPRWPRSGLRRRTARPGHSNSVTTCPSTAEMARRRTTASLPKTLYSATTSSSESARTGPSAPPTGKGGQVSKRLIRPMATTKSFSTCTWFNWTC